MSKPTGSPQQPASEPNLKRRRTDAPSRNSTPYRSGNDTPLSHFAARVVEERGSGSTTPAARQGEETEWVLNAAVPQANGHNLDSETSEDDIWSMKTTGRQNFGGFKRHKKQTAKPARDDADADLSSASEGEVSDSPPSRQQKGGTARLSSLQSQTKPSENASPLRQHAQDQARKRKHAQSQPPKRKKARKTM